MHLIFLPQAQMSSKYQTFNSSFSIVIVVGFVVITFFDKLPSLEKQTEKSFQYPIPKYLNFSKTESFQTNSLQSDIQSIKSPQNISLVSNPNLCKSRKFGTNFPPTAIHSFPGSGNTWLRYLIETVSGYYTGSCFKDSVLLKNGFAGERLSPKDFNRVVGIKSHNVDDATGEKQLFSMIRRHHVSKCVILVRNPFHTFIAEFNRIHAKGKNKHTGTTIGTNSSFVNKFQNSDRMDINSWIDSGWVKSYLNSYKICESPHTVATGFTRNDSNSDLVNHSSHVLLYEDLKKDLDRTLENTIRYLKVYDETRFNFCMRKDQEGKFHRKKHHSVNPFTENQIERIRKQVFVLNETLKVLLRVCQHEWVDPFWSKWWKGFFLQMRRKKTHVAHLKGRF